MKQVLRSARESVLARNALWVAIGQVARAGTQAAYVVLLARMLGTREFGAYAGVLAMAAVAAPFASLGSGNLMVKHVSRDPRVFPQEWGRCLAITVLVGGVLLLVVAAVALVWLPATVPATLVLVIGAADLVFVRLVEVSAQAYQAVQRLSRTALLQFLLSPLRLGAGAALAIVSPEAGPVAWGTVYLASAAVGGLLAVRLVTRELGAPRFDPRHLRSDLAEGSLFSATLSAQSTTNDLDKAMLARLGTLEATGIYAAAYRLVDSAFLPVSSVLVAAYARFFQRGVSGVQATARYAARLVGAGMIYGVLAGSALWLAAPVLPALLGEEYRASVAAVRWLAVLPLLKSIHYFGADALTGAGHQGVRTLVLIAVAGLNVFLNLWLIPILSWRGSAIATIVSDGLMGLAIWGAVWLLGRRASSAASEPGSAAAELRPR